MFRPISIEKTITKTEGGVSVGAAISELTVGDSEATKITNITPKNVHI